MQATVNQSRPGWLRELIAAWGFVQRNYYLSKRYFLWELVWLGYSTINAFSTRFELWPFLLGQGAVTIDLQKRLFGLNPRVD